MCWCCDPVCWVLTSPWSCPSSRCPRCPCGSCIWCVVGSAGQRGPDLWRPDRPRSGPDSGAWKTAQPAQPQCWRLQTYPDQNTETHTHTHTSAPLCVWIWQWRTRFMWWTLNREPPETEWEETEWMKERRNRGNISIHSNWNRKHEDWTTKQSVQNHTQTNNSPPKHVML